MAVGGSGMVVTRLSPMGEVASSGGCPDRLVLAATLFDVLGVELLVAPAE